MNQLKLALLSVHSCPLGTLGTKDTGGMSVYIRELAKELGKQGHLVDIYTRLHDEVLSDVVPLGDNTRLIHLMAGRSEIDKLKVYPHLPDFALDIENYRRLNGLDYDIIFSHYWLSGIVGEYLQKYWNVPHIIMFHTLGAVKNYIGIGNKESELRIQSERHLVRDCDRIIATTDAEIDNLVSHYGASVDKIIVIPCGVNLKTFYPLDKLTAKKYLDLGEGCIILFVGRIEPLKGIDRLFKAASLLSKKQKIKLVIIGGGEHSQGEVAKLQRLARELNIHDDVIFKGNVKQDRLASYYSAADVLAIPSYYESFCLVALESLACGTPVVANNVGDLRNIISDGETGFVVIGDSPEIFANKIETILLKADKNTETQNQIRSSVKNYHWPVIAQAVARKFQQMLVNYFAVVP